MVVAPFCSCPASLVSKKFLLSAPGVQSVCFFVALRWAPRPFGGARAKKKTPPRVFFFCSGPGERQGKEKPRWAPARGQSKKKNTTQGVFFFCSGPVPAPNGASPSRAFRRGRSKKTKYPGWCFFFCCGPAQTLTHSLRAWVAMPPPRRGGVFFFAAAPPGPGWCFFCLLWPRPDAHSLTVGWGDFGKARVVFFFFAAAPPGLFRQ